MFLRRFDEIFSKSRPFLGDFTSFEDENRIYVDLRRFEEGWKP